MKVLILPNIVDPGSGPKCKFNKIVEKLTNSRTCPIERDRFVQCSSDGVYYCDGDNDLGEGSGQPVRTEKKILMCRRRMIEVKESDYPPAIVTKAKKNGSACSYHTEKIKLHTSDHKKGINELEAIIKTKGLLNHIAGHELRETKQAIVKSPTPIEINLQIENDDGVNWDYDFLDYGLDVEYKIHPESGITMKDIEKQKEIYHRDYGNGLNSGIFNGKRCMTLVLQEGKDMPKKDFDQLAKELLEPATEV